MLLIVLISVIVIAAIIGVTNKHFKSKNQPAVKIEEEPTIKVASHEPIVDIPVEKAVAAIVENIIKPQAKKKKTKKPTPSLTKPLQPSLNAVKKQNKK